VFAPESDERVAEVVDSSRIDHADRQLAHAAAAGLFSPPGQLSNLCQDPGGMGESSTGFGSWYPAASLFVEEAHPESAFELTDALR
jgi:hypothetical protein